LPSIFHLRIAKKSTRHPQSTTNKTSDLSSLPDAFIHSSKGYSIKAYNKMVKKKATAIPHQLNIQNIKWKVLQIKEQMIILE